MQHGLDYKIWVAYNDWLINLHPFYSIQNYQIFHMFVPIIFSYNYGVYICQLFHNVDGEGY